MTEVIFANKGIKETSYTPTTMVFLSDDLEDCLRIFPWKKNVHWNKSDTGDVTVYAVSKEPVGVDIEYKKERPFEKISRRYFHEHEVTDDMEIFFDLWCQKEAYTKWKKKKIAENMRVKIPKYLSLIPLENLPDNVVGYLCT